MFILFTFSSLSLQSPTAHSLFIFTSSFCLFPSSFCSTVTLTSFSQFSSLRFLLQIQVHSFLFINFFSFIFFSHLPSSPRFHSQGMIFSIHISAWPEWNYIQNISPRRVGEVKKRKEKTPLGHIDVCSEEAFFFLCFFRTSTSGLWVWWVSIEESVDMVSLDALLLVCRGSNRWGSW